MKSLAVFLRLVFFAVSFLVFELSFLKILKIFQNAVLLVNKCVVDFDPEYTSSEVSLFNDGIHSTLVSVTTVQRKTWYRGKCYLKINMSAHKGDQKYSRQFLNTVVDMDKVVKGVASNVFLKAFLTTFFGVIDFKPGFPLKPVRFNAM